MGALLSWITGPGPVEVDGGTKLANLLKHSWGGIFGTLVTIILLAIFGVSDNVGERYLFVWMSMAVMWVSTPVPVQAVGLLPVFLYPLLGILDSAETCKCYLNSMSAMMLTGSMLWTALSSCQMDQRFFRWMLKTCGVTYSRLLLSICLSSTLLSMVTMRMLVVSRTIPIVEELLNKMHKTGQGAPYKMKSGKQRANYVASVYYMAVTSSASIGSIGFINASLATIAFLATMEKQYPRLDLEFGFAIFAGFTIPLIILMTFFNFLYLNILLKTDQHKLSDTERKSILQFLQQRHDSVKPPDAHQRLTTFSIFLVLILLLSRWPAGRDAEGEADSRFVRDSASCALFTVLLHAIPSIPQFLGVIKATKKSEIPKLKPITTVLQWGFSNKNTPWSYMLMIGGSVALIEGATSSGLADGVKHFCGNLRAIPPGVIVLLLVFVAVLLANFINFVAVVGMLMPFVMHIGPEALDCPIIPPLALGLACSLSFCLPLRQTPTYAARHQGHVEYEFTVLYGVGSAFICASVLYVALINWSQFFFHCDTDCLDWPCDWDAIAENST